MAPRSTTTPRWRRVRSGTSTSAAAVTTASSRSAPSRSSPRAAEPCRPTATRPSPWRSSSRAVSSRASASRSSCVMPRRLPKPADSGPDPGSVPPGNGHVEPAVLGALLGDVDVDVLDLGVLQVALLAELAADARLLVAAERVPWVEQVVVVDPDGAGAQPLGDLDGPGGVAAPDGAGQPVVGVVGDRDRLLVAVERDHRQHRPEDLLLGDACRGVDVGEDGGRVVVAALVPLDGDAVAAGDQLGALLLADAHVALHPFELLGGDQRAHVGGRLARGADGDALGDLDQAGDHLVVDRPGDQQAAAGGAHLALVEEDRVDGAVDREVEVGVLQDDVGRLAAELE